MNYLRDTLNVLGGFSLDAFNPRPVKAMAHFDFEYCNAFFSAGSVGKDVVAFGDCRCDVATPLVSLDIVRQRFVSTCVKSASIPPPGDHETDTTVLCSFFPGGTRNHAWRD